MILQYPVGSVIITKLLFKTYCKNKTEWKGETKTSNTTMVLLNIFIWIPWFR